jgi:hypothetical protein
MATINAGSALYTYATTVTTVVIWRVPAGDRRTFESLDQRLSS